MKNAAQQKTTREAILDATDRLLTRFGYQKMTIDDLAREVGIGKGSIYLHFSSKEDIALSHIDRIIEKLKGNLREIAAGPASIEERLKRMLVERVLFRFDSVQHYTMNLNDLLSHLRPRLLDRRRKYFEEEARIFAGVIAEGQATGKLIHGDALEYGHTLLLATNSLLPYSLSVAELGERREIAEKTNRIADALLAGLISRGR